MRKLFVALGATFVVLLGTGLYQAFEYVPHVEVVRLGQRPPSGFERSFVLDATELVHRIGAYVFCALVVAVILAWILRGRASTRATLLAVVVLTVLALATLAAVITGREIRWDQLALWAVTVGSEIRGVVGLDHVKFVLVGTTELSWSEFSSRVFLHLLVFPVGMVICSGVLWFLSVHDDRRLAADQGSPAAPVGNDDDVDLDLDATDAPT